MKLLLAHNPLDDRRDMLILLIVTGLFAVFAIGVVIFGVWKLVRFMTRGKNDE